MEDTGPPPWGFRNRLTCCGPQLPQHLSINLVGDKAVSSDHIALLMELTDVGSL